MNKKRKIITCAILGAITLSACGTIGYISSQNKQNEFISNQLDTNVVEKGISVKCAVVEDSTATYGAQIFTYSVNPNTSLNNVLYKISYLDGSEVDNSILTIAHDSENKTIQVDCNSVFTKQIILTLYLEHDENVKAEVTIDFVEIVEFDYIINCEEGQKLIVEHMFESTGGSISISRDVTNEVISWDEEWIKAVEEKFIECIAQDGYSTSNGYIKKDTTGDSSSLYLNSIGVNYFFNNIYTTSDFFYIYDLYWHDNESGEETYLSLFEFYNLDELLDLNIWDNVINYSCVWNNQTYECSFGINIDETSLLADEVSMEVSNLRFGGEISSSENESSGGSTIVSDVTIDYSKCSDKSALDGGSGVVLSSGYNNMWISDFVSVEPGKTIEFSSEPYKVCYYISDKTFIKQDKFTTSDTMTKTYTLPSNASYIRFQYCSDSSYDVPAVSFNNRTTISINYVD